jgi:uncharacterized protein DUF4062
VALKVMLSSVRRGLADVRDAVAPVLKILGYEVIRFEAVTKTTSEPPRATCAKMVEDSDIYLLILGEEYGDPMPGTDRAPTEEEWTVARNLGRPVVVFEKAGISPGPRQAAFIKRVKDYETGVWRRTFADTGDLISRLKDALADAADGLRPPASTLLTVPVSVPWLLGTRGSYTGRGTVLETHVVPIETTTLLAATSLGDLRRTLARVGQDHGLFDLGQAIEFRADETAVVAEAARDGRRPEAGVRVARGRAVSVWESLPTSPMVGAILDEAQFGRRVARDLRLAAGTGVLDSATVGVAIGVNNVSMLGIPNDFGGGISLPFAMSGSKPANLEPTDSWSTRSLAVGADEVGRELVARLMLRLKQR